MGTSLSHRTFGPATSQWDIQTSCSTGRYQDQRPKPNYKTSESSIPKAVTWAHGHHCSRVFICIETRSGFKLEKGERDRRRYLLASPVTWKGLSFSASCFSPLVRKQRSALIAMKADGDNTPCKLSAGLLTTRNANCSSARLGYIGMQLKLWCRNDLRNKSNLVQEATSIFHVLASAGLPQ